MKPLYEFPAVDEVYEEASIWISRMDKGLTADDEDALRKWLSQSNDNRAVFLEMTKLWDRMDTLSRLSDIFPHAPAQERQPLRLPLGLAASLVVAVVGIWVGTELYQATDSVQAVTAPATNLHETTIGEQAAIELPDGTLVTLNTNTLIRVSYTEERRLVTLERGEIHVQVSHDPSRRFSVIVNDHVVQAVGTEFNVEITSDQRIELLVTDGIVIVGILEGSASGDNADSPSILPPSAVSVSAGQEITLASSEEELRMVEPEEIEVKLSWTEGNLIFRGESLEEAITEISRYTSVEFRFLDEDSKRVRVVGLFQTGDVDGLLAALRENFNISFERIDEDTILLMGRK